MVMDREASSWALQHVQEALSEIRSEYLRPSVMFEPELQETNSDSCWIVKYGPLIATGSSPDDAMRNFDKKWWGRT